MFRGTGLVPCPEVTLTADLTYLDIFKSVFLNNFRLLYRFLVGPPVFGFKGKLERDARGPLSTPGGMGSASPSGWGFMYVLSCCICNKSRWKFVGFTWENLV